MIEQGYPLFAVDDEGGVHAVVGWQPIVHDAVDRDARISRPVLIDASGYLDPIGPMVWDEALRYFASIEQAELHSNGDKREPPAKETGS